MREAVSEPINLPDSDAQLTQRAGTTPDDPTVLKPAASQQTGEGQYQTVASQPTIQSMPRVPATPSFYPLAEAIHRPLHCQRRHHHRQKAKAK
jgi:hypothetical protein